METATDTGKHMSTQKLEHRIILEWIDSEAKVLDLGCGDGELLSLLIEEKNVNAQGIELSERAVNQCVVQGLNVLQQDIDTGLSEYGENSFDYVILNQTFQQVKKPDFALQEALRVSKKVIVGFPNFVYYKARFQIFFKGTVPVTPSLPAASAVIRLSAADAKTLSRQPGRSTR